MAEAGRLGMGGDAHRQLGVDAAKPARTIPGRRQEQGRGTWPPLTEAGLKCHRHGGQERGELREPTGNQDQPLVPGAVLEAEDPGYCPGIARVAAQAVAGFGRVGDDAAPGQVAPDRGDVRQGGQDFFRSIAR